MNAADVISAWWNENDIRGKDFLLSLADPLTRNERLMELAAMLNRAEPSSVGTHLNALEVILGQIAQLGNAAVDPGDYARAVGEARAKAEMALTRLRIIRSLLA